VLVTREQIVWPAVAGAFGLAAGLSAVAQPSIGLLLAGTALVAIAVVRFSAAGWVCALIIYLPFEGLVTSHVPTASLVWVKYGPEAATAIVALVAVIRHGRSTWTQLGVLRIPLMAILLAWTGAAVANGIPATTAILGFRTELRYLPILLLLAISSTPVKDARLVATAIGASAIVQAALAVLEIVGGATIHHLLAQHYTVQLGNVTLTHSTVARITDVTGTMRTYNELADFLVAGWLVLVCAGTNVALPRRLRLAAVMGIPVVVLATGSREGAAFLLLSAALIARNRLHVPSIRIFVIAAAVLVLSLPLWAPSGSTANRSSSLVHRVAARWTVALQPSTWSGGYENNNFRLYLAENEASDVLRHSASFGWGTGSVDDPRTLQSGTNPLLKTMAGRLALASNFAYDGSWLLLLIQTGIVGLAASLLLIGSIAWIGRLLRPWHWIGDAAIILSAGVAVVGFFAPDLQQHTLSASYWAISGCAVAHHAAQRRQRVFR
jgi:hypothetical protein